MRTRSKVLVALAAALVGVVGAEVLVRALGIGPIPQATNEGTLTRPHADPRIRYENRPGGSMRLRYKSRSGALLREVVASVNAQGFRGPLVETERTEGTLRIACVGDSQTFGLGVGDEESWPAVLETTLRAEDAASPVEVLNCGVAGYEIEQEVASLEERVHAFESDLVILGFFMNDTLVPGTAIDPPGETEARLSRILAPGRRPGFVPWLRQRSKIVDLGADWLFRRLVMRNWIDDRDLLFRDDFEGWIRTREALRRARAGTESRGGGFVVLLVPLLMKEGDEILTSSPYRTVSAFCRSEGILFYDPEPLFAGLDVDRMRVHPRDLHSTAEADRIIGQGLARWLKEKGLVQPGKPR